MQKWISLIVCLILPLAVGAVPGYLTRGEVNGAWYLQLRKPAFQPPGWVFGPVWTTLYVLMGISLWLIYNAATPPPLRTWALVAFGVQLTLNFLWSLIFFKFHSPAWAAAEILLLLASIGVMIALFYNNIRPLAAALQLPYLAWTTFATVLTCTITWMNRH